MKFGMLIYTRISAKAFSHTSGGRLKHKGLVLRLVNIRATAGGRQEGENEAHPIHTPSTHHHKTQTR